MSKKWYDSTGREVCDLEFDGRGKETYIMKATYLDDGSDVPEDELYEMGKGECFCYGCRESA